MVAAPPFIQMIWGAPSPILTFEGGKYKKVENLLSCTIRNKPITSRIMRMMGVERVSSPLQVKFTIFESGTHRQIVDQTWAVMQAYPTTEKAITQTLSVEGPIIFPVIIHDGNRASVMRRKTYDSEAYLENGKYRVEFEIRVVTRNKHIIISKEIVIGPPGKELRWLD
jgi:hypothetical protein